MNSNDDNLSELEKQLRELAQCDRFPMDEGMTGRLHISIRAGQQSAARRRGYRRQAVAAALLILLGVPAYMLLGDDMNAQMAAAAPIAKIPAEGALATIPLDSARTLSRRRRGENTGFDLAESAPAPAPPDALAYNEADFDDEEYLEEEVIPEAGSLTTAHASAPAERVLDARQLEDPDEGGFAPEANYRYLSRSGQMYGIAIPGGFEVEVFPVAL